MYRVRMRPWACVALERAIMLAAAHSRNRTGKVRAPNNVPAFHLPPLLSRHEKYRLPSTKRRQILFVFEDEGSKRARDWRHRQNPCADARALFYPVSQWPRYMTTAADGPQILSQPPTCRQCLPSMAAADGAVEISAPLSLSRSNVYL